ncbi:MAG: hypothetical protein ACTSR7_20445 [Promethearchaeota archaeon]
MPKIKLIKNELINIYYKKNKKRKSKRILLLVSVLLILPIFLPFIQGEFGNKIDNNYNEEILRNSSVYYRGFSGDGWDIFISGDYAFIADGGISGSLVVIDISDPTNLGSPRYESTSDSVFGVFAVIDISDPTNPGSPIYEPMDDFANGLYVSGDYAYVADGIAGLAVIDISDPTNPGLPAHEM